jgi:SAM-dependent methyltransferase
MNINQVQKKIIFRPDVMSAILKVSHFANSHYASWNIESLLASYVGSYVVPLSRARPISADTVIADVGTGYGWLAFALALNTPATIVAIDFNAERVKAARAIGDILGLSGRIDWRVGSLGSLPLSDREAHMTCCVEVIEHVARRNETIQDLSRTSSDLLLITTPNGAMPVVFHDTSLPFCHWLPIALRDKYARAFGRLWRQDSNLFWGPRRLAQALPDFRRVSRFFQYDDIAEWQALAEMLAVSPIGGYARPQALRKAYYEAAARFGTASYYILPNLGSIWRRIDS